MKDEIVENKMEDKTVENKSKSFGARHFKIPERVVNKQINLVTMLEDNPAQKHAIEILKAMQETQCEA